MSREVSDQEKIKVPVASIPCRFCGQPASFIDAYRSPFKEDQESFPVSMSLYYCPDQHLGFAYPVPSAEELGRYYGKIYRDRRRMFAEDPHIGYMALKRTPLAESQYMYLSQFVDFDSLQTVVDMGCGHGMLLRQIRKHNPNTRLIGIELDRAVQPFLEEIGAEFIYASAGESVDAISQRISGDTLLISSHTLHYQNDYTFIQDIIRETKKMDRKNVYLFVEVVNETLNDPAYVHNRVYDIPRLIFFTVETFQRGIFDLDIINVSTNGWPVTEELFFRRRRIEQYQRFRKHLYGKRMLRFVKFLIPIRVRKVLKEVLSGKSTTNEILSYYSYGGNRRAIRFIGRIA